jgi:glyoxylase-like metal-dependent hydrolase (beta-lactamase superfamily II)
MMKPVVQPVLFGYFRLDGGAMFGVVPKPLWERKNKADERNRILLALRSLLIKGKDFRALVDLGISNKMSPRLRDIYGYQEEEGGIEGVLARHGESTDTITHMIITHLHFDHASGATMLKDGKIVPTFPNARYMVQRTHLEWALQPSLRDRASFFKEDFEPLLDRGLVHTVDGDCEVLNGVFVQKCDGHTLGIQTVRVETEVGTVVYPSDEIPTSSHIPLPYIMGYDLQPLLTLKEKTKILETAVKENHILVLEHDPAVVAVRVSKTSDGFEAVESYTSWEQIAR